MTQPPAGYRNKTLAAWMGKNIGGTLGGPYEGCTAPLFLHYYDPVPTEPLPNDDLELQLVWLDMLRKRGPYLTPHDFVYHWRNHTLYLISEYFVGQRNMSLGLLPPMTGAHNNWWRSGMGATIRSEIWACLAPGRPDIAAAYAYLDATTDHAGEGVYGEMFCAALESAAFTESDPRDLVAAGLAYVPPATRVREAVEFILREVEAGTPLRTIRHLAAARFAHPTDFTYAPLNVAYLALGLLTGDGFGESLCNAVNCGYDTDCTGATLGAMLGIAGGTGAIPEEWLAPIGTAIVTTDYVPGIEVPPDVEAVTDEVCELGERVLAEEDAIREHLFRWTGLAFLKSPGATHPPRPERVVLEARPDVTLTADYGDGAAVTFGETKTVQLSLAGAGSTGGASIRAAAPEGWVVALDGGGEGAAAEARVKPARNGRAEMALTARPTREDAVRPGNAIRIEAELEGREPVEATIALAGKHGWLVRDPLSAEAPEAARIRQAGALDAASEAVHDLRLAEDRLRELLPQRGHVVFAQTSVYAHADARVRIVANSTGPVEIYVNGAHSANKAHKDAGILPTWHLQGMRTERLPADLGFCDVELRHGWNTALLALHGDDREERDAAFHLVLIDGADPAKPIWPDFKLVTGVLENTRRPG